MTKATRYAALFDIERYIHGMLDKEGQIYQAMKKELRRNPPEIDIRETVLRLFGDLLNTKANVSSIEYKKYDVLRDKFVSLIEASGKYRMQRWGYFVRKPVQS